MFRLILKEISMINILIADDQTLFREGLKLIISETSDMIVADEAGNGEEVLEKILKNNYDILLLDITMPGKSGLDVLKQLKIIKPKLPVIMLSMHPEEHYAIRALKSGASGYLTKESTSGELITAVRKVLEGRKYVSISVAEQLADDITNSSHEKLHKTLSDREFQVMCMIAKGKKMKEISKELLLSEKTVSTYRSRILRKMKMKNNAEVVKYAIKEGLVY